MTYSHPSKPCLEMQRLTTTGGRQNQAWAGGLTFYSSLLAWLQTLVKWLFSCENGSVLLWTCKDSHSFSVRGFSCALWATGPTFGRSMKPILSSQKPFTKSLWLRWLPVQLRFVYSRQLDTGIGTSTTPICPTNNWLNTNRALSKVRLQKRQKH